MRDKSSFDSAQAHKIFLVSTLPRPALDLTWSLIEWVMGIFRWGKAVWAWRW